MARVTLIHWNAQEAVARLEQLRTADHEPFHWNPASGSELRVPPPTDVFVIDLTRVPSRGRDVATALRRAKATRHLPLVFLGGDSDKVERTRSLLPDAIFADWPQFRPVLRKALARPAPTKPVAPGAMAGYSGTPLAKKLIIKESNTVALLDAPDGLEESLAPLPANVRLLDRLAPSSDVILLFCRSRLDLEARFRSASCALAPKGRLWLAWPKKTSRMHSDLTEPFVREYGLAQGFVDYKICAIDATWSGLCFARR